MDKAFAKVRLTTRIVESKLVSRRVTHEHYAHLRPLRNHLPHRAMKRARFSEQKRIATGVTPEELAEAEDAVERGNPCPNGYVTWKAAREDPGPSQCAKAGRCAQTARRVSLPGGMGWGLLGARTDLFILRMMGYCEDHTAKPVWFVLDELASLDKLPPLH